MPFPQLKESTLVYACDSKYNGRLEVIDHGKTRKLVANGILQSVNPESPIVRTSYWGRLVDTIEETMGAPRRLLILGMGGATIAKLAAQRFPEVSMVSVEIDQAVVDISRKYFELDSIPDHRVIVDDALRVVTSPEEFGLGSNEFDCVIVNIFLGEIYPELGNSGTFFAGLKKFLLPGGLAIFNRIYLKHHQDDVNNFIENVSDYFSDVKSLIVAGRTNADNVIITGFA